MLETTKMTDKELDEAITNHLKRLNDLEVKADNADRKKLNTSDSNDTSDLYYMDYTGDWSGNPRTLLDNSLNTTGNPEWKCKTPYSIPNPNPVKCNLLYSNISSDTKQRKKFPDIETKEDVNLLSKIRRNLANYQEKQGIPKVDYPFSALIKIMGQATGKSLLALFYIIINIAPMLQIVLFITRFILDKIINIQKTKDRQQMGIKTILLIFQLSCVYICLTFIIGLIWMPVLNMILRIISCCTIDYTNVN